MWRLDFALQPCHSRLPSWTNPVAKMTSTSQYICSPAFHLRIIPLYAPFAWNHALLLVSRCPSPWCLTYSLSPLSIGNMFILQTLILSVILSLKIFLSSSHLFCWLHVSQKILSWHLQHFILCTLCGSASPYSSLPPSCLKGWDCAHILSLNL